MKDVCAVVIGYTRVAFQLPRFLNSRQDACTNSAKCSDLAAGVLVGVATPAPGVETLKFAPLLEAEFSVETE
jgi:hypothetical protein